jgi:tripartite-type tricarboxylate transporter receptor subunit TctC
MRTTRRALAALAAAAAIPRPALAERYPARPVRILVGFTPGGATDIQARQAGQWLSERLGQQFLVDNRPGASGNIATEMAARAAPDGYTLMQLVSPNAINQALYRNLPFDLLRDFAPVICMARLAYAVVVNPALPVRSIAELIAHARAVPDRLSYGSAGSGTPQNIAAARWRSPTCWPGMCRWSSRRSRNRSSRSGRASCGRWR